MIILVLCIILNAAIGIIFKLFDKYKVNIFPAIVVNYFTCVITATVANQGMVIPQEILQTSWCKYAIFLGIIFVTVFNIVARTVQSYGVMVATIFQKMSLIAPAILGVIFYSEPNSLFKTTGILLALVSILLISMPDRTEHISLNKWWLLALTFVGSSLIELTLFYVNQEAIVANADIRFVASIFLFAGITGSLVMLTQRKKNNYKMRQKDLLAGVLLGIPNFFSIFLILYLLDQGWQGSELFPINNVGVLVLASLAGIILFKENLNMIKALGFIAAITSIILIAI